MNSSPEAMMFEPDLEAHYTLEMISEMTGISTVTILLYHEHGLIRVTESHGQTPYFTEEALHTLRRIEHLISHYEASMESLKLMLELMDQVDRLQSDLRARR